MASTVPNNRQDGRKPAQKYKSLLVWQVLLKRSDRERLGYEIGYTRKSPSGFMITQRPYDFEDLRLLAECINSENLSLTVRLWACENS